MWRGARVAFGAEIFTVDPVVLRRNEAHNPAMRNARPLDDKLKDASGAPERGYAGWKRAKVETGLEQSRDRDAMIPAEKLLRNLGIES